MDGDRIEQAMSRIDAALARIEAAATRQRAADPELEVKYSSLREAVKSSLVELDELIAGQAQ